MPRTNAKACTELGIEKTSHSAHHKKHIAKVMAHCVVGYLFEGDVEAGGEGFLISCDRCASFKMPLRNSYVSSRDESGKLKFKVNAIKNLKGVPYLVDCPVTGTDVGGEDDEDEVLSEEKEDSNNNLPQRVYFCTSCIRYYIIRG